MADFQEKLPDLEEAGIRVFALSAQDREAAGKMVEEHGLEFPVGYGLDPEDIAERFGAWIDRERGFVHATGFLLDPDGEVATAVYSSGAIGRLGPEEVVGAVRYLESR